jgi:hypothetical protein
MNISGITKNVGAAHGIHIHEVRVVFFTAGIPNHVTHELYFARE